MKIIATIGPNSSNRKVLAELINNGVDIFRLNFSHFYESEFIKILNDSRSIKKDISIMADLCGKKVRVAENLKSVFKVYTNDIVYFCSSDVYSLIANNNDKSKIIPLNIKSEVIEKNDIKKISMKDGTMNFDIIDKDKIFLKAIAKDTGVVRGGKGCNIPGADLGENSLNDKDKENLKWAIDNNIDIIGQSYVESSRDILCVREYIKKVKGNQNDIKIFSKLETIIGLNNYKEIMNCSDGIVIARGDLVPECGMEISVEQEFELLKKLRDDKYNKEIIIATHVLDSMKSRLNSNINEIESIYTFINNGATGFLLAGETSIGKYPVQTAKLLNELIKRYKKY
ncbi:MULTISPECIES: pyruvate kinase [Clostridia]|uniref:Pyruvate kinase n=1 Tax=Clostridium saudiense TaxID=1414720 RepID=A0ABS2FLP4_9CLOT|nr:MULTISPECIES: pyruvate kinase [Clostridiaceae]MBM6820886.1 pyruvate kinase [Clostridium saudiense]